MRYNRQIMETLEQLRKQREYEAHINAIMQKELIERRIELSKMENGLESFKELEKDLKRVKRDNYTIVAVMALFIASLVIFSLI